MNTAPHIVQSHQSRHVRYLERHGQTSGNKPVYRAKEYVVHLINAHVQYVRTYIYKLPCPAEAYLGGGSGGSGTPLRLNNGRGCQKFRARKLFSTLLQHILDTRLPRSPPHILKEGTDGYLQPGPQTCDYTSLCFFFNPLVCLCTGGKSEGHIKRCNQFATDFSYEGNEYRLIATKKNRISYFD